VNEVHVGTGWWQCPRCPFRREFATTQGALRGPSKHLRDAHQVRAELPREHFGGLPTIDQRLRQMFDDAMEALLG
jgi:hypothetical protein